MTSIPGWPIGIANTGAFYSGNYSNGVRRGRLPGLLGFSSERSSCHSPASDINGGVGHSRAHPHSLPDILININETRPLVVPPINVPAISLGVGIPNISIGPHQNQSHHPVRAHKTSTKTITLAWPVSSMATPNPNRSPSALPPFPQPGSAQYISMSGFSLSSNLQLFPNSAAPSPSFSRHLTSPTGGRSLLTSWRNGRHRGSSLFRDSDSSTTSLAIT